MSMRATCIITDAHYGKAVPQEAAIEAKLLEHGAAAGRGGQDAGDGRLHRSRRRRGLRRRWGAAAATIPRRWWAAGCMPGRSRSGRM